MTSQVIYWHCTASEKRMIVWVENDSKCTGCLPQEWGVGLIWYCSSHCPASWESTAPHITSLWKIKISKNIFIDCTIMKLKTPKWSLYMSGTVCTKIGGKITCFEWHPPLYQSFMKFQEDMHWLKTNGQLFAPQVEVGLEEQR